jgi:esterase/lipase
MGEKVIVMGTSTGGTLALKLAAEFDTEALVLLSPNVRVNHDNAEMLHGPWGLQIARLVIGDKYLNITGKSEEYAKYWYTRYRLEGTVFLGALLKSTMQPETFQKITEPVFVGAYYKDEQHQDPVVKVSAMRWMFENLSSAKKEFVEFPKTEDHVMGCNITSKDVESVEKECIRFMRGLMTE